MPRSRDTFAIWKSNVVPSPAILTKWQNRYIIDISQTNGNHSTFYAEQPVNHPLITR